MFQPTVMYRAMLLASAGLLSMAVVAGASGCLKVGGDEPLVRVNAPPPEPAPVDTSRVPPVSSAEEGRQRLAEAYARIDYLERELAEAQRDKEKARADLKNAKRQRDDYKDRLEKLQGD